MFLGSSATAFSYALRASSKRPSCSYPMPRLFQAAAYVGSTSTAFSQRYVASFQRPFWATFMPKSTCAFAWERASAYAYAGSATPDSKPAKAKARATAKARHPMAFNPTIATRPNHRKLLPNGLFRGETVLVSGHPFMWSEQCTYHNFGA